MTLLRSGKTRLHLSPFLSLLSWKKWKNFGTKQARQIMCSAITMALNRQWDLGINLMFRHISVNKKLIGDYENLETYIQSNIDTRGVKSFMVWGLSELPKFKVHNFSICSWSKKIAFQTVAFSWRVVTHCGRGSALLSSLCQQHWQLVPDKLGWKVSKTRSVFTWCRALPQKYTKKSDFVGISSQHTLSDSLHFNKHYVHGRTWNYQKL